MIRGGGISEGFAQAMQAMWRKMYRTTQSLNFLYDLYAGTVNAMMNFIPMVLIFVETNWPGSWFVMDTYTSNNLN